MKHPFAWQAVIVVIGVLLAAVLALATGLVRLVEWGARLIR